MPESNTSWKFNYSIPESRKLWNSYNFGAELCKSLNLIIIFQNQKKTKKTKHRIPWQNHANHENLIIKFQNHENHEVPRIPLQNQENLENLIIPCKNYENHDFY